MDYQPYAACILLPAKKQLFSQHVFLPAGNKRIINGQDFGPNVNSNLARILNIVPILILEKHFHPSDDIYPQ